MGKESKAIGKGRDGKRREGRVKGRRNGRDVGIDDGATKSIARAEREGA